MTSEVLNEIDTFAPELKELSLKVVHRSYFQIHSNPELAFKEFFAHNLLTDFLERKGFKVSRNAFGLETAFLAEFGSESSDCLTVGFLSEYDALPEIGHACGHNLIAIVGVGAALGLKKAIEGGLNARVKLFGTPAEEEKGGKIDLINAGAFKSVDIALMAHPGNVNCAYARYLALQELTIEYFGKAAHASASPWDGINALDAAVIAYQSISNLRQQILPSSRVHGIITHGGDAPNIIPAYTSAKYYIRATEVSELLKLKTKVLDCFAAASKATGCALKITENPMFFDVKINEILSEMYLKNMESLGETFPPRNVQESISRGSTDMGNVTYHVPGIHPVFNVGTSADIHTVTFRDFVTEDGPHIKALKVMKSLVLTAIQVVQDSELLLKFKKNLQN